jgi:hypothetical protein
MKGAFFSGGYATPDMSIEKQKEMLALQMIHMKQVFENMWNVIPSVDSVVLWY